MMSLSVMTSDVLHGTYDVFIPSDPSPGLILLRCDMVLVQVVGDVGSLGHGEQLECTDQGLTGTWSRSFCKYEKQL